MPRLTKPEGDKVKDDTKEGDELKPISVEDALQKVDAKFEGHPADKPELPIKAKTQDEKDAEEKAELEAKELKEKEEKEEKEKKSKKELIEKKIKLKYSSQEEAEEANKEAARKITEGAESTKRERERNEALQKQYNELLAKTKTTKESEKAEAKKTTDIEDMEKVFEQISKMDPDEKGYQKKVAAIWAKLFAAARKAGDDKTQAALKEFGEKLEEKQTKEATKKEEQSQIVTDAEKIAIKAGLDMKDGSSDSELFWLYADKAPDGTIEDQVKYAIDKTIKTKKSILKTDPEAEKRAEEERKKNEILGRHGLGKPEDKKKEPVKPISVADAVQKTQRII